MLRSMSLSLYIGRIEKLYKKKTVNNIKALKRTFNKTL